jgi:alpha-D-ribose 1-methylphosphonate 5-triphosphate synthase subunit PhnH
MTGSSDINEQRKEWISLLGSADPDWLEQQKKKDNFFAKRKDIVQAYPLGIDMIFVCDRQFTAIPRTTTLEVL